MTDERREETRRSEDQVIAQDIADLKELRVADNERLLKLEQVFYDTMLGPEDALGQRVGELGMKYRVDTTSDKVDYMYEKFTNGGIRVQLPRGAWVAIVVAIIAGVFQVVAALASAGV